MCPLREVRTRGGLVKRFTPKQGEALYPFRHCIRHHSGWLDEVPTVLIEEMRIDAAGTADAAPLNPYCTPEARTLSCCSVEYSPDPNVPLRTQVADRPCAWVAECHQARGAD